MNDGTDPRALGAALLRARALIATPHTWTPDGYATNAWGQWRPVGADDASRFSLLGAVFRAGVRSKAFMEAAREFLAPRSEALYAKLTSAEAELSHAESLEVLDVLIHALTVRPVPKQSGFVPVQPGARAEDTSLKALGERLERLRGAK